MMLIPQLTRPWSQFNTEQSNEMGRCHPSPPVSVSRKDIGRCPTINLNLVLAKESTPAKRCWYHSWQDHDPSLTLSNQMKWRDVIPPPPVSVSCDDIGRCLAINLNLILSKESTPAEDVGTTVNKTMIPA
jgi:hypothetical protein